MEKNKVGIVMHILRDLLPLPIFGLFFIYHTRVLVLPLLWWCKQNQEQQVRKGKKSLKEAGIRLLVTSTGLFLKVANAANESA